jgi:hypothetical protein
MNINTITNLLALFLLQGLHQKWDNKLFSQSKILEASPFLELFSERRFHFGLKFINFVADKRAMEKKRYNCGNYRVVLCASPF